MFSVKLTLKEYTWSLFWTHMYSFIVELTLDTLLCGTYCDSYIIL
uniref:Uncharacterized protein n=1 Tax=Anguilla anguilla TaxID=7936 RepID=A0A0E9PLE5_ANGAN